MNLENTADIFDIGAHNVVEELNVTSDTIMGYPNDARDFFDEISNGNNNGDNLAAVMVPYIILFFVVLLGVTGAVCAVCCCAGKKIVKVFESSQKFFQRNVTF